MAKPITAVTPKKQHRKKSKSNSVDVSSGRRKNTSNKNSNNNLVVSHQFYCTRLFSTSKTRSKFPRFNKKMSSSSSLSSNLQNVTPELFLAFIITAILVMFILFSEATAFPELRPVAPSDINNHLDRFINFHQNNNLT